MNQKQTSNPIGVFDSGLGGLTVLKQLIMLLPAENFIYFADIARLPYGEKNAETIIRYSVENASFLLEKEIKMLIVACATSTAYSIEKLQQFLNIPVLGVIEPGAESALQVSKTGRIGILATRATVNSGAFEKAILKKDSSAQVFQSACPLFVPLVEEQFASHPAAHLIVQEYTKPLKEKQVDTILLGCTHYPLLKEIIQQEMGPEVSVVDSSLACAQKAFHVLEEKKAHSCSEFPSHQYYVSDDPQKFQRLGQAFLGVTIPQVYVKS